MCVRVCVCVCVYSVVCVCVCVRACVWRVTCVWSGMERGAVVSWLVRLGPVCVCVCVLVYREASIVLVCAWPQHILGCEFHNKHLYSYMCTYTIIVCTCYSILRGITPFWPNLP